MIYIICIVLGTVGTVLSIIYAYELSGADPYIYTFIVAYTISLATLNYGWYHTRRSVRKDNE